MLKIPSANTLNRKIWIKWLVSDIGLLPCSYGSEGAPVTDLQQLPSLMVNYVSFRIEII